MTNQPATRTVTTPPNVVDLDEVVVTGYIDNSYFDFASLFWLFNSDSYFDNMYTNIDPSTFDWILNGGNNINTSPVVSNPVTMVTVDSVVNNLVDTCLKAAFDKLTSDKLKGQLNKLYQQTFVGTGKKHNLEIIQTPHVYDPNGNEVASISHIKSGDATTWVIEMSGSLDNYPLEIFGNIISHEMVHGFLQMNDLDFTVNSAFADPHKEMLDKWICQTQELLVEAFGIPANDALALSLTGYDDVLNNSVNGSFKLNMISWINLKYSINLTQAEQVSDQYFNKLKGTVCH